MFERTFNLSKLLGETSSAFLLGARGTGKTFLSRAFMQGRPGLTFELLKGETFTRYLSYPEYFRREIEQALGDHCLSVYLDEVQKLPKLLDEVHQLLSDHPKRVRFLLTGSSARKLKRESANMLAGRAYTAQLYPLTFQEHSIALEKVLHFGSLPGIVTAEQPELALRAYYDTYLKEEIIAEAVTRKLDVFTRFLELAAQYDGKPINFSDIARSIRSSPNSVASYFQILEETLVAVRLDGWSHSVKKQLLQAPKFYFFDCGVLNAIRGELSLQCAPSSHRFGTLFENYVINEFFRLNSYYRKDCKFFYWRTKDDQEVDLLCSKSTFEDPIAVEIKSASAPTAHDFRHLKSFAREYPKTALYCLCTTPFPFKLEGVEVLPWQEGILKILDL
jgi:predicted AAA+ superfamily ATPase